MDVRSSVRVAPVSKDDSKMSSLNRFRRLRKSENSELFYYANDASFVFVRAIVAVDVSIINIAATVDAATVDATAVVVVISIIIINIIVSVIVGCVVEYCCRQVSRFFHSDTGS